MARLLAELNPPCLVYFAGWEATTFQLGREGWDIAIEEDYSYMPDYPRLQMILRHKPSGLSGLAECSEPFDLVRWRSQYASHYERRGHEWDNLPRFRVRSMGSKIILRFDSSHQPLRNAYLADTEPKHIMVEERDLLTLPLFERREAPVAEQLIVEPQDVASMLEQIRKMQSPEQAAIRARNRSRERASATSIPQIHATILTFPRAA